MPGIAPAQPPNRDLFDRMVEEVSAVVPAGQRAELLRLICRARVERVIMRSSITAQAQWIGQLREELGLLDPPSHRKAV